MDEEQRNAVKFNMADLCRSIDPLVFMPFLRIKCLLELPECDLINREPTSEAKVLKTFDLLMPKWRSWEATLEFLGRYNLCPQTVSKLKALKWSIGTYSQLDPLQDVPIATKPHICQFIDDVVNFYRRGYRAVESFDVDGDSDLIESVWVDLQLEGRRKRLSHYRKIFVKIRAKHCQLAIVSGQPGSGKTTLAKKIAYDWARKEQKEIFDLVLAVPLRDVQPKSDLLEMAVGFYVGNGNDAEVKRIAGDLRRSQKFKILLIFDGLDELQAAPNSVLSKVFCSAPESFSVVSTQLIRFDFDLLVLSRPFACQLIQANIAALKYEIVGFSEENKVDFVNKRCKTPEGKLKAMQYINQSSCLKEISQNPFLLTLICFLSDHNESIPSTLTKLYGTFVHRMLIRAARKNAVGKDFDTSKWQQSKLLKNLGSLALFGVIKNQFQFNQDEMQMCHVTKEYFHSGLLQYRSDPVGLALKCDFPHRSIQDFLAAFYAVHYWGDKPLMEATGWPMSIWPTEFADFLPQMKVELLMAQVIRSDSQFCRFFFGLTSGRIDFSDRYRLILAEIIGNFTTVLLDPIRILVVGCDMADCSDEENFVAGQIANDLADLFADPHYRHPNELEEKKIKFAYGDSRDLRKISFYSLIGQLTVNFRRGMKFSRIGRWSFSVGSENPQNLKIFYFDMDDRDILDDIGKLLPFSHIGYVNVRMDYLLHENIVAIRHILTQIRSVDSLCINEFSQPPYVDLMISVGAQQADSPKCFSLKHLRMRVSSEIGQKMLEKFQSETHFQAEKIKVSAVEKWKFFNDFSVVIVAENCMSNVEIWNAVGPD